MIYTYTQVRQPKGFKVGPLSILKIRQKAEEVEAYLLEQTGQKQLHSINFEKFLESEIPMLGLEWEIIPNDSWEISKMAPAAVIGTNLKFREHCYIGICSSKSRDIFTLFHELGHVFLGHSRQYNQEELRTHTFYEDSEWQANRFAAEILMPVRIILLKGLTNPDDLQMEFVLPSYTACWIRCEQLRKEGIIQGKEAPTSLPF